MPTLYHARDVIAARLAQPIHQAPTKLKCIVLRRNKQKRFVFLSLQDESAILQAVIDRESVDEPTWELISQVKVGDAVTVIGTVTDQFKTASVLATQISPIELAQPSIGRNNRILGAGSPINQVLIARLVALVRTQLEKIGYVEIATRLISSTPPSGGVYPLRVLYEGYGAPFHIAPSPAPQLIDALTLTAYDDLFAVSRCFTQVYRDPFVSVESVIVTCIKRKESIAGLLALADMFIRDAFLRPDTKTNKMTQWPPTRMADAHALGTEVSAAVSAPEFQIFADPQSSNGASEIGRLCWPLTNDRGAEFKEYVLAEGYTAGRKAAPAFAMMSINIDRLLTLIMEQADMRRIPALGQVLANSELFK